MKKLLCLLSSLLLLCTACGKLSDAPESDAKQQTPVLEESESPPLNPKQHEAPIDPEATGPRSFEERALGGEAVEITEPCAVDLDKDGTPETVDFGDWTLKPEGFVGKETWLRVGKAEIPVSVVFFGDLYLFTPDGNTLMLAMQDEWYEYWYEYRDGALTEILPRDGRPLDHEWVTGYNTETGCVCTHALWTRVQCNMVSLEYQWQDANLHLVEQDYYEYDHSGDSEPNRILKRSFHFYTEPSKESETVLFLSGTELLLLGQQGDEWAKLKIIATGEEYWINARATSCYDADGTEIDSVGLLVGVSLIP